MLDSVAMPMHPTQCQHCGERFEVPDTKRGGIANCPGCGEITEIAGAVEPVFVALLVAAAIVVLGISAGVFFAAGPAWGLVTLVVLGGIAGLATLAL